MDRTEFYTSIDEKYPECLTHAYEEPLMRGTTEERIYLCYLFGDALIYAFRNAPDYRAYEDAAGVLVARYGEILQVLDETESHDPAHPARRIITGHQNACRIASRDEFEYGCLFASPSTLVY